MVSHPPSRMAFFMAVAFAETLVTKADLLIKKPSHISFAEAACLPARLLQPGLHC